MKNLKLEIGDCFRIPLPNGKWAYCQYVAHNGRLGYLVRVFSLFTDLPETPIPRLLNSNLLFPPVFVGLKASVKSGRWKKIGHFSVDGFAIPQFRDTMGTKPGVYRDWSIWNGEKDIFLGELPENLRSLELKQVWGDEGLEERIVVGTYRGDRMF